MRVTTFVVGAAAGYVMGSKAGRKRYEQIRKGYETAINSPVAKAAVTAGRKALANAIDPEPRMKELKAHRVTTKHGGGSRGSNGSKDTDTIFVPDED